MPKTPIHKYRDMGIWNGDIGCAGQTSILAAKPDSASAENFLDDSLGKRI